MLEEQLKQSLIQTLVNFSQEGLTIGTEFYILKDVFNDFTNTYQQYLLQQATEQEAAKDLKEEKENDSNDVH